MAFTFDTALGNDLSKVRFHIGDVGTGGSGAITGAYLADETINYWVGVDATLGEAVIHSLQFIVTQLSTPSFTADGLTIDTSAARAGYEKLLKVKQQEFGVSSGATATSTIKHAHRADSYEYDTDDELYTDPSGGAP